MRRTVILRDIPDRLLRALRERARRNRRSLQSEIFAILAQATADRGSLLRDLNSLRKRLRADMTLEEIHEAIEQGRP